MTHLASFRATLESLTASGCSPVDYQELVGRHMLLVRHRYDAVIAAGEGHVCLTNSTEMN